MLTCSRLLQVVLVVSIPAGAADVITQPRRAFGLGDLRTVAASPDEARLASAGQTGAFLWDAQSGEVLHRLEAHGVMVTAVAFSPDGRTLLTGARDGTIRLWAVDTGASLRTFLGHQREINALAFAPDGRSFVSAGSDNSARVWSVEDGGLLHNLVVPGSFIHDAAFAPDGNHVATADDSPTNNVGLWDLATGARIRSFGEHVGPAWAVAFLTNGLLASAGEDRTVRLWNPTTGERVRTLEGATGGVFSLIPATHALSVLGACLDGRVLEWDAASGEVRRSFKKDPFSALSAPPDLDPLTIATVDNLIHTIDPATGAIVRTYEGHTSSTTTAVAFSPDERYVLSGGTEALTRLWNRTNARPVRTFLGQGAGTAAAAFSPDGTLVLTTIGFPQKAAQLWRTETGQLERELLGHTDWLTAAVFSADGSRIATSAQDATVRLWDTATGNLLRTFTGHVGTVLSVALSPNGRIVAGGGPFFDPTVRLWNAQTGELLRTFEANAGHVEALGFSPSGAVLMVGWEDGLLRLFDVGTGDLVREIVVPAGFLDAATFSPDGELILTGESFPSFTARLWDARSGELLRVFVGHTWSVNAVAFNPRGNWILTGGDNVRLWNISDVLARLHTTRTAGGLELRWRLGTLQQAASLKGPWDSVPDAISPWTVPGDQSAAFYRVATIDEP